MAPTVGLEPLTRRRFLAATTAAALGGVALPRLASARDDLPAGAAREIVVPPDGPLELVIGRAPRHIAGRPTDAAITVNGSLPGPILRMREGQDVEIHVHNALPDQDASIHWHGVIVPATMDGVPGISFPGIKPGETYIYRYRVRQNGTYWYHSHSGLQEQLGLYGPLVIDAAESEPIRYDREHVVMLSDWMFGDPYQVLGHLKKFDGYYNYQRPTVANLGAQARRVGGLGRAIDDRLKWSAMRMDPTDITDVTGVVYTYLMNGRSSDENWTATARGGERVRLRLINGAAMTYFDFRIPGIPMTVVAADGQHVKPVEVEELRIAVAECYDILVTMPDDEAHTMFAETADRSGHARGTLAPRPGMSAAVPARRTRPMRSMAAMGMGHDTAKPGDKAGEDASAHDDATSEATDRGGALPTENLPRFVIHGPDQHGVESAMIVKRPTRQYDEPGLGLGHDGWRVLTYGDLRCLHTPPDRRAPRRQFQFHLTGNMGRYVWGFDGKKFSEVEPIPFEYGERLRINMINDTLMSHPIHLHGMWMDLYAGGTLADNPRKHTVNVKPRELLTVDISADAPGRWAFHCHLVYHMEAGMFRTVAVVRSLDEV